MSFCVASLVLAALTPTVAARPGDEPVAHSAEWQFAVIPDLWGASLDGSIAAGSLPAIDVDASFGELLENLDFAAATFFTARKGSWSLLADISYVGLEIEKQVAASTVTNESELYWTSIAGGYRIETGTATQLDVFAGARYFAVDNEISSSGGVTGKRSNLEDWVDPIVGILLVHPVGPEATVELLADVGGFGVGSDLTYEIMPSVSYALNESLALRAGFRWMDVDFEDSDFEFDATQAGFLFGLGFRF